MKVELLAPAKDLEIAKIALRYGADAVYLGGKQFSLRSAASNFSLEDIDAIVSFAHELNRKVYVTVNMVFHDADFDGLKAYLEALAALKVDALIVESFAIMALAQRICPQTEVHLSTQCSLLNSAAIAKAGEYGAKRVILAREADLATIKTIVNKVDIPVEVFIHGGMCANYSGRCTLSNRMTLRDANRGGCAQSCRWQYRLFAGQEQISADECPFSMSAKDLKASAYLNDLIACGVASFKIEGRMKSAYYIAQIVKTYRRMIDEITLKGPLDAARIAYYDQELAKAENRPTAAGFFSGECAADKQLYQNDPVKVAHYFVAYILAYDPKRQIACIRVHNKFKTGDRLEVFGPEVDNLRFTVGAMTDDNHDILEVAARPLEVLYLKIPFTVHKHDMIRKVSDVDQRRDQL